MKLSPRLLIAGTGVLALAAAGCSSPARPQSGHSGLPPAASSPAGSPLADVAAGRRPSDRAVGWSAATSAAAGGGMTALIAAARKEGALNVIGAAGELGELRRDHEDIQQAVRDPD